jgi:hypothetical protein
MQVTLQWRLALGQLRDISIVWNMVAWAIFEGHHGQPGQITVQMFEPAYTHYDLRPHLFLLDASGDLIQTLCYCWGK